jgi:hypothetical protein
VSRKPSQTNPVTHPPSCAILIPSCPARVFAFALAVTGALAGAASKLPSLLPLTCPDCLAPTQPGQIRAPNQPPKASHFRQAQSAPAPAPPSCRSGCQFTHAFIRTHSRPFPLLPLLISLTHPGLPPATPPTDPVFTPQILSSIPRNPPTSKQFLSQTTARSTKGK